MERKLVTRNEVRKMGLNVTNTSFIRYEKDGLLTPLKVANRPSSRVYYALDEVMAMLSTRSPSPAAPALRKAA
jgi:hypothetical protein